MSDASKSPFKSIAYEDDLLTWLQYPADDAFERSYCSDVFQGWPPQSEAANNPIADVISHEHKGTSISSMGTTSICETRSVPYPSHARTHMGTKPSCLISKRSVNAEEALAQAAARAAGQSLQVGHNTYNKVRTLMQPTDADYPPLSSTPGHLLNSCKESKDHPIKPNFLVSSIQACAPKPLKNATSTRLNMFDSPPPSRTKHATPETTTASTSKRARTEFEAHSETHQTESSRITEEGSNIDQVKVILGAGRKCTRTSTSCSEASQSSMSLSCSGTAYSGKRKQEELELLSEEYVEDDFMDTKKGSKSSSRRNRVAEVHNLSERNRRNRINEKLKALQDLIPNSSKTDKASVLDEAIEYMKTLQMQLQMISLRNSTLNVSTMMMPMNFPQAHMQMAQPHSIGFGVPIGHPAGMGMGLGVGMSETGPLTAPSLLQCPAAMSQLHAMPFHNGSMAGFAHMGFLQATQISPTMQNIQGSYDLLAQRASYMHQHEQGEPSIEQDEVSD